MTAREGAIVRRIVGALRSRGCLVRKVHGTAFAVRGDPDLHGVMPGGRAFAIEVKMPGKEPTPLQRKRLAEWEQAGAATGWAASVDEALAIVEAA